MQLEPVPTAPVARRGRFATLLGLAVPVLALLAVVGLAWPADGHPPKVAAPSPGASPGAAKPSLSPPASPAAAQAAPPLFPDRAFGLPVQTVEEILGARRAGLVDATLLAVAGYLAPDLRSLDCQFAIGGATDPFCRRSLVLVAAPDAPIPSRDGDGSPIRSTYGRPHLHPQVPIGTLLPRLDRLTIDGADDAVTPRRVVLIGQLGDPRAVPCIPGRPHCGEELVVERLAWADGEWRERAIVRDPELAGEAARGNPATLRVIASRQSDRGEVILGQAIVGLERLREIDPAAADAIDGSVQGPVWYLRSMRPADAATGWTVTWAVIDDATGYVLAVSAPDG